MKNSIQRFMRILKQIGIRSLAVALAVMLITAGLATYIGIPHTFLSVESM